MLEINNRQSVQQKMELETLLQITQSINNNVSESDLYAMLKFSLRGSFKVKKCAVFVFDEIWECKTIFGNKIIFTADKLDIEILQNITKLTFIKDIEIKDEAYQEYDVVLPIKHKDIILAYIFLTFDMNIPQEDEQIYFIKTLANIVIVAIENKKLIRQQLKQASKEASNQKEMEIAKQVQSLLFPKKLPYTDNLKIKATYFPHALIGGDYYDFIPLEDNNFILCIADVSGKGVPAALLMSNFQASLRTLVRQTQNLSQIITDLNHQIYFNAEGGHFITFLIVLYNEKNKTLHYINAGHNPSFLFDFDTDNVHLLESGTTILGVFSPLPFVEEGIIQNLKNFYLFNYTDGVTETINDKNEQLGSENLLEILKSYQKNDLTEIHENLIDHLNQFKEKQDYVDDITMLSCKVESK